LKLWSRNSPKARVLAVNNGWHLRDSRDISVIVLLIVHPARTISRHYASQHGIVHAGPRSGWFWQVPAA
jgi:hypothetical protein